MAIMCSGSLTIGMGHIMRTLVIAEKLKNNFDIYYICKKGNEYKYGVNFIKNAGYPVYYKETAPAADILLLDSYNVNEATLSSLRKTYGKLIYIDDLAALSFYDCDIIINKDFMAKNIRHKYNTPPECELLLGADYALLREEFQKALPITIKKDVKNVLITMGGTDPKNTSVKILNIIKNNNFVFNVAVSNGFSEKTKNELNLLSKGNKNIILHQNPKMSKLMSQSDIAITACGGTTQEIASIGLPQIAIAVADNQKHPLCFGEENDIFIYGGNDSEIKNEDFFNLFISLSKDYERRKNLSKKQKNTINKNGVNFVEKAILKHFQQNFK